MHRDCHSLVPSTLRNLASWSDWLPFVDAATSAPRLPGVYLARKGLDGPVVYVGMAGERNGQGLRGRLSVYRSGKALTSGLGEAVFDRAIADPTWLAQQLAAVETGSPSRAKSWGRAAFQHADLRICWATTVERDAARALENACLQALHDRELWNRRR